jgi:hypothetical protein
MAYDPNEWRDLDPVTPLSAARMSKIEDGVVGSAAVADFPNPSSPTGAAIRAVIGSAAPATLFGGPGRIWSPRQALPTTGMIDGDIVPHLGSGKMVVRVAGTWKNMDGTAYTPATPPTTTTLALAAGTPAVVTTNNLTEGSVVVTYDTTAGTDGLNPAKVRLTRSGTDTLGGGTEQIDLSPLDGSHNFVHLKPSTSYTITARLLDGSNAPIGTLATVTVNVPAGPAATSPTTLKLTAQPGDGFVTVTASVTPGADNLAVSGVAVSRNGVDANGTGAWTNIIQPGGSTTFNLLLNGTEYTFTGDMQVAGTSVGNPVAVKATPVGGGVVTPPPSGVGTPASTKLAGLTMPSLGWFSGVCGGADAANGGEAGTWRGSPLTAIGTWIDAPNGGAWGYPPLAITSFTGPFDVALGGPTDYAAAANGSMDGALADLFQRMRTWRTIGGVVRPTIFRACHEMNGNWYPWSVFPGMESAFRATMKRWRNLMNQHFPEAFWALCFNGETTSGIRSSDLYEAGVYDIIGVDRYNQYPIISSSANNFTSASLGGDDNNPIGIERWRLFAQNRGLPLYMGEWGHHVDVGDDPYYAQQMVAWFKAHAGRGSGNFLMDLWFNIGGFAIRPDAGHPAVAAGYANSFP